MTLHFSDDILSTIKDRLPVSEVVGKRVLLKQKGKDFLGLCPFHNEKTPSFTVNDQKEFYHCFGCGAHGDIFRFLVDYEKRSFPEAVSECALLSGVTITPMTPQQLQQKSERDQLFEILNIAKTLYADTLHSNKGQSFKDYLIRRGITPLSIKDFQLGCAITGELKKHLTQKNISLNLAEKAGALKLDNGEFKERFWDRLVFPILDIKGRTIGFGGRTLGESQPKYLNSSENDIFHKSDALYGIHRLNPKKNTAIFVEGYLDVIALVQAGFSNVFAPMGTSVTIEQAKRVLRHCQQIYFCFDGDNAGGKAMRRAADIFLPFVEPGIELRFVRLNPNEDPHSVVTEQSHQEMLKKLKAADNLITFLNKHELEQVFEDTPSNRALRRKRILTCLDKVSDHYLKSLYKNQVFELFKKNNNKTSGALLTNLPETVSLPALYEQSLLKAFLLHPELYLEFMEAIHSKSLTEGTLEALSIIENYVFSTDNLEFSSIVPYIKKNLPTLNTDELLGTVNIHAPFLSTPNDTQRIKDGIAEILDYFDTGISLDQHISDMQQRFKQTQDPKDWDVLKRLITQKAQRHNDDDR